jgi:hypothetical protein
MDPSQAALFEAREFTAFQGKTLAQKIQEIADREEIKELMSRYGIRVARGESCVDMYTDAEDAVFITRGEGRGTTVARGHKQLIESYSVLEKRGEHAGHWYPVFDNYVIKISGDQALALCSVDLLVDMDGKTTVGSGYYENILRREDGRWKFVRREATFVYYAQMQPGAAKS